MCFIWQRVDDVFSFFEQISPYTTLSLALEVITINMISISKLQTTQRIALVFVFAVVI